MEYINPTWRKTMEPAMKSIMQIPNAKDWIVKSNYLGHVTKKLYDAGVPMVIGSDAGAYYTVHGISTIDELRLLQKHGVNVIDILMSATINGVKALNFDSKIGSIQVGMKADIILMKEDPRQNLSTFYNLQGIIKKSIFYNKESILQMKRLAKNHMNKYEQLGWYLINF